MTRTAINIPAHTERRKYMAPPWHTIILLVILAIPAVGQSRPASAAPATDGATLPFDLVLKHLIVKATVNHSRPLAFIFDTGDKLAIVDMDCAKELGLKLAAPVQGSGGGASSVSGAVVQDAQLTLAGLDGFSQPVALAFPLHSLSAPLGHDIDGIIGSDFLQEFVTEIDYENRVVRLHRTDTFQYSGPGQSIPMQLSKQGITIEAQVTPIGGKPLAGRFLIDVGSGASLALYSPFVAKNGLLETSVKTIRAIGTAGVGGEMRARIGRVQELKIGKYVIPSPITLFSDDDAGAFSSSELQGNIGQQVLSRFKIFLDYDHLRMILEPARSYGEPFTQAFAGIVVVGDGPRYKVFRVADVLENSPASEVGLQKGDVITAVDGRSAEQLSVSALMNMFEKSATYRLDLKRGENILHVTLRPRELI